MITGQRNFLSLGDGLPDRTFETKNGFELNAKLKTFFFNFAFFSFLYGLFTNRDRKLEVAGSNPIMENVPISLFVGQG